MNKNENSVEHLYGEKLRQLQKEKDELQKVVNDVKGLIRNTLPTDDKFSVLHKIRLIVKC